MVGNTFSQQQNHWQKGGRTQESEGGNRVNQKKCLEGGNEDVERQELTDITINVQQ